jgi:lipopolysaccharide/colanic/teichoic acid biosynthesis glycosyltransferase
MLNGNAGSRNSARHSVRELSPSSKQEARTGNRTPLWQRTVAELARRDQLGRAAFDGNANASESALLLEYDLSPFSPEELCNALPIWKRALDLGIIVVTSACLLKKIVVKAHRVALNKTGPIIYKQPRVGFRGRRFMIVKFRTMKVNAETLSHETYLQQLMISDTPMTKLDCKGDPRLILGGKFLRATGLDELPQIFNVLRGEMSVVGPRPCTVNEFELYSPADRERLNAVPGLTGFWQVNGKNNTTFRQMVEMDVFYSRNISPRLDLTIIARTLPTIASQLFEVLPASSRSTSAETARAVKT